MFSYFVSKPRYSLSNKKRSSRKSLLVMQRPRFLASKSRRFPIPDLGQLLSNYLTCFRDAKILLSQCKFLFRYLIEKYPFSLVYSTAKYCAAVWCRSPHTHLINSVLNDALRIVTGCLRPTLTKHSLILSGIQPAELRRLGETLSLAHGGSLDPDNILYGLLSGFLDACQERLRSRRPFVPAAQNLVDNLAILGIRASEWKNHIWNAEYCKNASRLPAFVPGTGSRPVGMGLARVAWVKLNRLRTGVGQFHSSMHKRGLAPSPNCECGASEETAGHVKNVPHTSGTTWNTRSDGFG